MNAPMFVVVVASLSSLCQAQARAEVSLAPLPPPTSNNTFLDVTFSDPGAANCGQSTAAQNESVTITIRTFAAEIVCMDLDYIFTHPNVSFAPGEIGADYVYDGNRYTLSTSASSNVVGWSPSSYNYSQIFFSQLRANLDDAEDDSKLGKIMIRTFADSGCPSNGLNYSSNPPWYSWNCADETGHCSHVPFSVKSVLFSGLNDNKIPGQSGCVNAVKYDAGTTTRASLFAVGFIASIAVILMF